MHAVSALGRRSARRAGGPRSECDASKLGVTGSCCLAHRRNECSVSLQVAPSVWWSNQHRFKGKKMEAIPLEEAREINSLPKALSVVCLSLKVEIRVPSWAWVFQGTVWLSSACTHRCPGHLAQSHIRPHSRCPLERALHFSKPQSPLLRDECGDTSLAVPRRTESCDSSRAL